MKLILHIGVPKSGTTAIQSYLENLPSHLHPTVAIPKKNDLPGNNIGNQLCLGLLSEADRIWSTNLHGFYMQYFGPDYHNLSNREFSDKVLRHLDTFNKAAEKAGADTVFLSNEALSMHLDEIDIERFTSKMRAFYNELKMVIYTREQTHAYESLYGQLLTSRAYPTFEQFVDSDFPARCYSYLSKLKAWQDLGWKTDARVYYEKHVRPAGWNIFEQICKDIRVDQQSTEVIRGVTTNESLPADCFSIRRKLNQMGFGNRLQRGVARFKPEILGYSARIFKGNKRFRARHTDQFRKIHIQHKQDNEIFFRDFFRGEASFKTPPLHELQ